MSLVLAATLTACENKSCKDCERMAELQAYVRDKAKAQNPCLVL